MEVAVGIVGQRENERAAELAATLIDRLERTDGVDSVAVDEATGDAIGSDGVAVAEMADRDLVASIGGDGTLLFVAREVGETPVVGVNLGEVGFLNAVAPEDAEEVVTDLVAALREEGSVGGRELDRLRATGDDAEWALPPALNEVVVHGSRRGHGGGVDLTVDVDGATYTESRADGVLVATPTGSTAYNLSEGGPLVHPDADSLVVTTMAATGDRPPLVVDDGVDVAITVAGADTAWVISDGRNRRRLEPPATVSVSLAEEPITLAGPRGNFFEGLGKIE